MGQDLHLIWLYCWVEASVRSIVDCGRLRCRGPSAALTDPEAITIELWGEMQGFSSDIAIWRYADRHLRDWFPNLPSRANFSRQCANLRLLKEEMQRLEFKPSPDWNAFDGLPVPVCKNVRAKRDRRFSLEAHWSYCASKKEWYYGFKVGAFMNSLGEIYRFCISPAHVDERVMVEVMAVGMPSRLLADKGMISADLSKVLAADGTELVTPMRQNMRDERPSWVVEAAMRLRRRIETAFGCLVDGFDIARTHGRDFWRWSARICRKIMAYNLTLRLQRAFEFA